MQDHDLSKLKIDRDQRDHSSNARIRRRRTLKWLVVCVVPAVALLVMVWFGILTPALEVEGVKVSRMFVSRALTTLNATGYVVAQRKAAVSSKATGRISAIFAEEGKLVKEGDVLAKLENEDLQATLEEARASLRVAGARLKNAEAELTDATLNYNRIKSLKTKGALSQQAFDVAEARFKKARAIETSTRFGVERARAAVKVTEVNLEYSFIRAPFDGVILTKNADIGEVVAPFGAAVNAKAAVVTMADMDSLMVEVDVSESNLEKVNKGGACEIRLDAFPKNRFSGKVHMIVPTADRAKATVLTKVKFDELDPKVLPEMSAKVAFLSRSLTEDEKAPILAIPRSAVRNSPGRATVFLIRDQRVDAVSVKIGRRWNDTVEILDGLKEGDLVVLNPVDGLEQGSRVTVKE